MQGSIVVLVWVAAVVFASVVLSFLLYELSWKSKRLATQRERLGALMVDLSEFGSYGDRKIGNAGHREAGLGPEKG